MTTAVAHWKRLAVSVALAALVGLGMVAAPAAGQGYQLNGLAAGCTEPGGSNSVHGNKFDPGSQVSVALGNTEVAVATADEGGDVDGSFVVPSATPTGATSVNLAGPGTDGVRTLSFDLQVGGCTEAANVGAVSGGGGSLAFTGGDIGLTVGIGAAIVVVGVALVVAARKRRGATSDVPS